MAGSFPPDVLVFDNDALLFARLGKSRRGIDVLQARAYRFPSDALAAGVLSPSIENETAIAETVRRVKRDAGRIDGVSLLLPDSWFRIHILEVQDLPDSRGEADEVIRWALKRSLPIRPEELRIAYQPVGRTATSVRVLVIAALEKTLATFEKICAAEGIRVVLIEPIGMNIWNAITVRETPTQNDRIFLYLRNTDFTTAVFRGAVPLFVRSRKLTSERSIDQEIKLSASYVRGNFDAGRIEQCWVAGDRIDDALAGLVAEQFGAPVRKIALREFATPASGVDTGAIEAELAACTGVFTS
jgi:Tfp pilus assembly PilM family ATPase